MTDDAADFFRFLTNSYLAEPTPETAQRLWRAVFALEGLYFLLRPVGSDPVPAIAMQDGVAHLMVWTDLDSLRLYLNEEVAEGADEITPSGTPRDRDGSTPSDGTAASDDEPQFLFAPLPKVIEHILRYEEHGVGAIRFNAPLGWSVPMDRFRSVATHLRVI